MRNIIPLNLFMNNADEPLTPINSDAVSADRRRFGTIMMLCASLCFSTGGLLMKVIPWNPLAINGARNVIAAAVIGLYILITRRIVILMYLFFGQKPDRTALISILIVFAGILCFFFEGLSTGKWLGDLLALLSGVFYAGVFMLNSFEKGDALSSVFFGQLACGVFLSPMVLRETDFSAPVLLAVFLLGAVQVGLAYIFFTTGTKYTDPVTASIINALEPILNPVLVAVFYGEMLGRWSLVGAVIVLCGIMYYNLKNR